MQDFDTMDPAHASAVIAEMVSYLDDQSSPQAAHLSQRLRVLTSSNNSPRALRVFHDYLVDRNVQAFLRKLDELIEGYPHEKFRQLAEQASHCH